jgi:Protein of unknown function
MSPELVDQAILAQCRPHFYKVARVILKVAEDLDVPLFVGNLIMRKELKGTDVQFIADRIKALVKAKKLELAGDLKQWGKSEIRLTDK